MADAMSDDFYDEPVDNEPDAEGGEAGGEEAEIEGDGLDDEIGSQARAFVDEEGEEEEEGEDEDEDEARRRAASEDEEEEKPSGKKGSRAEKRIQSLIQRVREQEAQNVEATRRLQRYEQEQQRFGAQYQERMRQMQEDRERLIAAEKELELLRRQRELTEEEGLDPAERLKRQAIREANELNRREREQELSAIRQEHEQFKQQVQQQREQAAREARISGYDQQATFASAGLLEDLPTETAQGMFDQTKTMVLNWAAAHGYRDLRDAANDFDKFAMKYALAKMRLRNKARGAQRKKGQEVPSASPTSKRNVKGRPIPTMAQATAKGHEDVLDAMRVQRGE